MSRALSYLIAAQVQAVALIMAAWLVGRWLNENHPIGVNWYVITFPVGVLAVGQTFYVIVRRTIQMDKKEEADKS
jgi:energy-converting hydrogenase Eha subunit A